MSGPKPRGHDLDAVRIRAQRLLPGGQRVVLQCLERPAALE